MVASPATLVTLGDLHNPVAILCLLGFVLITALNHRGVIGGTLIGILIVTAIGIPLGLATYSGVDRAAAVARADAVAARLLAPAPKRRS